MSNAFKTACESACIECGLTHCQPTELCGFDCCESHEVTEQDYQSDMDQERFNQVDAAEREGR